MVLCGDSASVGLFNFFYLLVSISSKLIIVSGVLIFFHFFCEHKGEKKVFGIVGGPEKGLGLSPCLH